MDLEKFRFFPVQYTKDPVIGGYTAIVRGCNGATEGETIEDATKMAKELVFDTSFFKFDDREVFCGAGSAQKGDHIVDIGVDGALKLMLRNLIVKAKISQGELGRRLGLSKTEISSVVNPRKSTRLATLVKCFETLGSPLNITC